MKLVLGIHCGHEASCAVVRDGVLVAAVQQERVTLRKYDGQEFLSDRLPIGEVLDLAGCALADVDLIVSEFQAVGPSAVGLQRPLFSPNFSAFDPFDRRHTVISHHLAHAASTAYLSGFAEAGVLVSDSAGTTSRDGADYFEPFPHFFERYRSDAATGATLHTELRSIYRFDGAGLTLVERDFGTPHNQPDVYVQSEASLFDNVSRFVFRDEHAHGQLMALAGLAGEKPPQITVVDLLSADSPLTVRNGWQLLNEHPDPLEMADVAAAVQAAFTRLVIDQALRTVQLTGRHDLCCAGGVFLNLAGNTAISALAEVDDVYVPSCPHDAGISAGAALYGAAQLGCSPTPRQSVDFLGREAGDVTHEHASERSYPVLAEASAPDEAAVDGARLDLLAAAADALARGGIVARYAQRSEFGPRALGNRSLLAHPVACPNARARMNQLKHRQPWRPVAPMVLAEDAATFFEGPSWSPFMNFEFAVREEYRQVLTEVTHADGTARVQIITADTNPDMWRLLTLLAERGLVPILVNTSLNGPGQPIIDAVSDVLDFVAHPEIDHLLTDDKLLATPAPPSATVLRPEGVVMAMFGTPEAPCFVVSNATDSAQIGRELFLALATDGRATASLGSEIVRTCLRAGLLIRI